MLPHWTQNNIVVDGIQLHYTRTGDGSKPPLVLAHGFSDNGLCWLPVAGDLEAEYNVILPDARGHGLSARVQPGEAVDRAADLAGLMRGLGLDLPIVGGHSMGASTSAQVEVRFPGLVRALILEDPPWREPEPPKENEPEQPRLNPFEQRLKSLEGQTVEELMAKCQADNPTWPEVELRPWAESKKQFDPGIFQTQGLFRQEWPEVVRAIHCPTLLITADPEKGAIVTPEISQKTVVMNSQIRVVQVAGAGHNIRRENYPEFMAAVRRFLREIGS